MAKLIPIAEDMPRVILSLVWSKERTSPAVELFRDVAGELHAEADAGL